MFVFKSTFKSFRQYLRLSLMNITAQINSSEKYTDAVMEKTLKLENRVGNLEGVLFEKNLEARIHFLEDLVKELQKEKNN